MSLSRVHPTRKNQHYLSHCAHRCGSMPPLTGGDRGACGSRPFFGHSRRVVLHRARQARLCGPMSFRVADECDTMQLAGPGGAEWACALGPTFEPDGRCFGVDGPLTITLQSDRSTISGPLTGLFCPRSSCTGHQHARAISYGNPFVEDDSIAFTGGTGPFARLSGAPGFPTFAPGAPLGRHLRGTPPAQLPPPAARRRPSPYKCP